MAWRLYVGAHLGGRENSLCPSSGEWTGPDFVCAYAPNNSFDDPPFLLSSEGWTLPSLPFVTLL